MAKLLSVCVGLPRDITWQGRTVRTAVWKSPVAGRVRVRRLNIDGDGQGDLAGHGGEQRAVFVYQIESYRHWEQELGRNDFVPGQFGENFTVEGLPDDRVCVGDRYRIGTATFEVTQPRVTCYRVGIRMNEPRMPALLTRSGRPGFYFRVIEEGEVGAGDAIVKVADGAEQMTIAEVNALLYMPGHPRGALDRALRISALSPGWRGSFQALLDDEQRGGNAGLAPAFAAHPASPGFTPLRVTRIDRETEDVLSFWFEATDNRPLPASLPGQFVVLRLFPQPGRPLFRSYSLSGSPSSERYRISVKVEPNGAAGTFLRSHVREGQVLDVSAPRGGFVLREGDDPVVLVSAGIGATPILAMLHALASTSSKRDIWWLYGARNHKMHPFSVEARELLKRVGRGKSYVVHSRPSIGERQGTDFDAEGHLTVKTFEMLGVPRNADFYLCGPQRFLDELPPALGTWGVSRERIHTEIFGGGEASTPGVVGGTRRTPHVPDDASPASGSGPLVSFARSGLVVRAGSRQYKSLLELAEASDVPVRWSCRTGVCHSCESGLLSGAVRYDPEPLDPPSPGNVLICCSQPEGDVVLDL
ncbi:MAG: MOSC domain-containing protein [Polyangiaceae bacterium]|nr:MOSC domain-containing protein [Polyangiaceae bacterium]